MRDFVEDGYIYIWKRENSYVVSRTGEGEDGYNIPSVEDPYCDYSYSQAVDYWDDNPDMRYEYVPPQPTPQELIEAEVFQLKQYLSNTDWAVSKCYDRGLVFADEYPDLYVARQQARDRINELENN